MNYELHGTEQILVPYINLERDGGGLVVLCTARPHSDCCGWASDRGFGLSMGLQ